MFQDITPAQITILQNYILANHAIIMDTVYSPDLRPDITPIFNDLRSITTFKAWNTYTIVSEIQNAISWANFTPANPGTAVDLLTAQNIANWMLACQGKQFNLQLLLSGGGYGGNQIATGRANIRAGLQDCLTAIPSGTLGANKSGGWAAVQLAIQRFANKAESLLFSSGAGTQAVPYELPYDCEVGYQQVLDFCFHIETQPVTGYQYKVRNF